MARSLRIQFPGATYHVYSRGNARAATFLDDADRCTFLSVLHEVISRFGWILHAYCLMGNHYHLVVETREANLSLGMQRLNGIYTQQFNKKHARVGHVFQGRYGAQVVGGDSYFLEVCRYVVLNPVRAGFVARPEDWLWSSYRATAGLGSAHPALATGALLEMFGLSAGGRHAAYSDFVQSGTGLPPPEAAGIIIGADAFVAKCMESAADERGNRDISTAQRLADRPSLEAIFMQTGVGMRDRDHTIVEAVQRHRYPHAEVGRYLGLSGAWIGRIVAAHRSSSEFRVDPLYMEGSRERDSNRRRARRFGAD